MNWYGLFFVAAGIFAICGAGFDWEWFMNNRKARFFVATLSRPGARIFYCILGLALVTLGTLMTPGIVERSS